MPDRVVTPRILARALGLLAMVLIEFVSLSAVYRREMYCSDLRLYDIFPVAWVRRLIGLLA